MRASPSAAASPPAAPHRCPAGPRPWQSCSSPRPGPPGRPALLLPVGILGSQGALGSHPALSKILSTPHAIPNSRDGHGNGSTCFDPRGFQRLRPKPPNRSKPLHLPNAWTLGMSRSSTSTMGQRAKAFIAELKLKTSWVLQTSEPRPGLTACSTSGRKRQVTQAVAKP